MVVMFSNDEVLILKSLSQNFRLKIFYGILSLQRLGLCQDLIWSIMFPSGFVRSLQAKERNDKIKYALDKESQDINYTYMDPDLGYYSGETNPLIDRELKSIYGRATEDFYLEIKQRWDCSQTKALGIPPKGSDFPTNTKLWCHSEKFRITGGDIIIRIYTQQQVDLDAENINIKASTGVLPIGDIDNSTATTFSVIPDSLKSFKDINKQFDIDSKQQNFVIDVYNNMNYKTNRFYQNNFTYIIPAGHYGHNGNQDTRFNIVVDKGWIFMKPY